MLGEGVADHRSHQSHENVLQAGHANPSPTPVVMDTGMIQLMRMMMTEMFQTFLREQAAHVPLMIQVPPLEEVSHPQVLAAPVPSRLTIPELEVWSYDRALKVVSTARPDTFDGSGVAERVVYWFVDIERVFRGVPCSEYDKVNIAALLLRGTASRWWESTRPLNVDLITWDAFKKRMIDRYFSQSMRENKQKELLYPNNEDLKVTQLYNKFNELLPYVGHFVQNEEDKIRLFHDWMPHEIKPMTVRHGCDTLEEYMDAAYKMETTLDESRKARAGKRKSNQSDQGNQQGGFKRPALQHQSGLDQGKTKSAPTQSTTRDQARPRCFNCGDSSHLRSECGKPKRIYWECGKVGHIIAFCRSRGQNSEQS